MPRSPLRFGPPALLLAVCLAGLSLEACGEDEDQDEARQARNVVIPPESKVPRYANDPQASKRPLGDGVLRRLPKVQRARVSALAPNIRGSSGQTLAQFLDTLGNDIGTFWQGVFNRSRFEFRPARQAIVTSTGASECLDPPDYTTDRGPFYCNVEDTIHLPAGWFARKASPIGDTAVALVVAHEWGHRIQDLLGTLRAPGVKGIQIELQADCLGGVWAASVYERGLLEPGDLEEGAEISRRAGDAPGTPVDDPRAHGSSAQRMSSFLKGYEAADPGDCTLERF